MVAAVAAGKSGAVDFEALSRQEIKDYLCALAEKHVEARESYTSLQKDPARDWEVWQGEEGDVSLVVTMAHAEGLTVDDFCNLYHRDNILAHYAAMEERDTYRRMDGDVGEGAILVYCHSKSGMFLISDRCCFETLYDAVETPTGGLVHVTSSKGNKRIDEANEALIGRDVLMEDIFNYHRIDPCPYGKGVNVSSVICVDPCGGLPNFVKSQLASECAKSVEITIAYLRKQKGL